jgi:hypothetical protein
MENITVNKAFQSLPILTSTLKFSSYKTAKMEITASQQPTALLLRLREIS